MYICIKYLKQFLENLITVYMHTIKRLVVDLNLPNRIGEHEGVDEANRLYDRYIKDTLDNVLSSYPEEIELIFPELIIDLGEIESYNMPAEIERRLRECIEEQLFRRKNLSATTSTTRGTSSSSSNPSGNDIYSIASELRDDIPVAISKEEYALALLMEYLEKGHADLASFVSEQSLKAMVSEALRHLDIGTIRKLSDIMRRSVSSAMRFAEIAPKDSMEAITREIIETKIGEISDIQTIVKWLSANGISEDSSQAILFLASLYLEKDELQSLKDAQETLTEFLTRPAKGDVNASKMSTGTLASVVRLIDDGDIALLPIERLRDMLAKVVVMQTDGVPYQPPMIWISENRVRKNQNQRVAVEDAGLVIVHPFFRMIFSRLNMLDENGEFVSIKAKIRATKVLKLLATGQTTMNDASLVLEKMICGVPLDYHIRKGFVPSDKELEEVGNLLKAVTSYWDPFMGTSIETLRGAYLLRKGTVEHDGQNWIVRVEGKSIDILMDTLPWGFNYIVTKWTEPIIVDWQKEN